MQKNQEREMLQAFKRAADKIVADLEADGVAEQVSFFTLGEGAPPLLMTPGAFTREQLIILISGIPESTGVWSYTLLQQGKKRETSMEPYFKMARSLGWGLVALNPHGGGTEGTRGDYGKQLDGLVHNLHEINIVKDLYIICFSAGGSVLVEYLNQRDGLAESVRRMVLIDTTPPPLTKGNLKAEVRALLDRTKIGRAHV